MVTITTSVDLETRPGLRADKVKVKDDKSLIIS